MRHFIGIDQSYSCTGMAHIQVNDNGEESIYFRFTTNNKKLREFKENNIESLWVGELKEYFLFSKISKYLEDYIKNLKGSIHVAIENGAFGAKGRIFQLGELSGAIKASLVDLTDDIITLAPQSLKKFSTGHGRGGKTEMYLAYVNKFPDSSVLNFDKLNKSKDLERQLKSVKGKPLTDLIDSHFLAEYAKVSFSLRK